jgi:hypothetical protein
VRRYFDYQAFFTPAQIKTVSWEPKIDFSGALEHAAAHGENMRIISYCQGVHSIIVL